MEVCDELNTVPIRLVKQQLKESEICLQHIGLNTSDVIALMYALLVCNISLFCYIFQLLNVFSERNKIEWTESPYNETS